jgi:GAF domain-containing protein
LPEVDVTQPIHPRVLKLGAHALVADELHLSIWLRKERIVKTLVSCGMSYDEELYELDDYPLTELVLSSGLPMQLLASDTEADAAETALLRELGFNALLMLPVIHESRTVGLLEAYRLDEMGWTSAEITRALAFARQLGAQLARGS